MLWGGYHNTECNGNKIFFTKYNHNAFDLMGKKPFLNFFYLIFTNFTNEWIYIYISGEKQTE